MIPAIPDSPTARAAADLAAEAAPTYLFNHSYRTYLFGRCIVTDRDIVCGQLARQADLFCLNVSDVMTSHPVTVQETSGVAEAVGRLSARGVRRAPEVNEAGDLVGLVSFDDLLPAVAAELAGLAQLIGAQARQESVR